MANVRPLIMRVAALVMASGAAVAIATTYPVKPVRFILTNPPGGTVDTLGRVLADELTAWVRPIVRACRKCARAL